MIKTTAPSNTMKGSEQGMASLLTLNGVVITKYPSDRKVNGELHWRRKLGKEQFDEVFEAFIRYNV